MSREQRQIRGLMISMVIMSIAFSIFAMCAYRLMQKNQEFIMITAEKMTMQNEIIEDKLCNLEDVMSDDLSALHEEIGVMQVELEE